MTGTSHDSFTIERHYDASRASVFDAWAKPELRERWFAGGEGWTVLIREQDFRTGGHERVRGQWQDGRTSDFRSTYHDIVDGERIVFVYDMYVSDEKISVSVATVELYDDGGGTRMRYTEQGAYLEYADDGSREQGSNFLVDRLGAFLEGRPLPTPVGCGVRSEDA
ncbi:MAG TPA: SRPBCC family protein [Sphingomonas sp.]|uniref:SRPBCC family protein n=1 Tax=Sphingomonas sp. TaxID=28214 RepID=UPI002C67C6EB|nr:SRPBCC family protein [Sphingomonas sp.]HMI19620.1 SRPBCC family protein [Sphingomonas sp.]